MQTLMFLLNDIEIFGSDIIKMDDFLELIFRFTVNMSVILIIVRYIYYNIARRKDYLFSYVVLGTVIFLLCFLLENVKLQLGFALGLFAIFGIIRYRTRQVPIKEMTYLFLVIGVSVINALANKKISYAELLFTNVMLIFITYGLEKIWLLRHESSKLVNYEKIDLIKGEHRLELIQDLQERTGIKVINRIEIGRIDFLRDTARIKIYYFADENLVNTADDEEMDSGGSGSNDDDDN